VPGLVDLLIILGKAVFIFGFALTLLPLLIWFERKGSAFIQDRAGPNRAGIFGIRLAGFIHNISDVVKLLMKEMMIPPQVNRTYFMIAPILGFTFILTAFAVIPWADHYVIGGREITMQVADMNCGILYILAITSLNVFGIILAGWSSNNKFALMGGLRSTAQMISYEIPLGLALVGIFMVFQSAQLNDIVRGQVYRATDEKPLEVPENAVVVPGSRAVKKGQAAEWNLSLYTPVIVKYRDEKTDQRIELEEWLR